MKVSGLVLASFLVAPGMAINITERDATTFTYTTSTVLTISEAASPGTTSATLVQSSNSPGNSSATSVQPSNTSETSSGTATQTKSHKAPCASVPFALQVQMPTGQPAQSWDGWYLNTYHTGAGYADVTLSSNLESATVLCRTNTTLYWDCDGPYPWITTYSIEPYSDWARLIVQIGETGFSNFTISDGNLVALPSPYNWNGWMVCPWWHQALPQLFMKTNDKSFIVDSCAIVNLVPVARS